MKYILIFFGFLFCAHVAFASSVNLGLKIKFKSGMSTVNSEDLAVIDELIKIKEKHAKVKFLIAGHTDSLGDEGVNQVLSEARAESVQKLLKVRGVRITEIEVKGYSERAPISSNRTAKGRSENRRVVATLYGLTPDEASEISQVAEASPFLYVISVENTQVEKYVKEELEKDVNLENFFREEDVSKLEKRTLKTTSNHRYLLKAGVNQSLLNADEITGAGLGADAEWVSKNNFRANLAYQYNLFKSFWVGLEAGFEKQNYKDQTNLSFTWDGRNPSLVMGALALDYELKRFNFGLNLAVQDYPLIVENSGVVSIVEERMFGLTNQIQYLAYNDSGVRATLGLEITLPLSSQGDLDAEGDFGGVELNLDVSVNVYRRYELVFGGFFSLMNFEYNNGQSQSIQMAGVSVGIRNRRWF